MNLLSPEYQLFLLREKERNPALFYSPLAGKVTALSDDEIRLVKSNVPREELPEHILMLLNHPSSEEISRCRTPFDNRRLSIVPGYSCNFSCSYCYAAAAHRSGQALQTDELLPLLKLFFEQCPPGKSVVVAFTGGGEPLLYFDFLKAAAMLARKAGNTRNIPVKFELTTNGSLLTPQILAWLKEYDMHVRVSFEPAEQIQNRLRQNYAEVHHNITVLLEHGIKTAIRSVITPDSVSLIPEMAELVRRDFPALLYLDFEPVCSPACKAEKLEQFLSIFREKFWTAYDQSSPQLTINSLMLRIIRGIGVNFCSGDLCILPGGQITWCHRVTPDSHLFPHFAYTAAGSRYLPDTEKYETLMNENRCAAQCRDCFAKWNCAGGCLYQKKMLSAEQREAVCRFIRKALEEELIRRINGKEHHDGIR